VVSVLMAAVVAWDSLVDDVTDLSGELGHRDGCIDNLVVNDRSLDVALVDLLCGVVVLDTLSLSVNDWLNLLDNVLVYVFADDRSIDGGGVCLVTDGLQVLLLSLRSVSVSVLLRDILSDMSCDLRCDVLVVRVLFLLVNDWLNFLVDLSLLLLSVYDRGNLMVSVLLDVLV